MIADMKRAFDLSKAAKLLVSDPAAKDFVKAVKVFDAVSSVRLDLQSVEVSARALSDMRGHEGDSDVSSLGLALMTHAVVTYSRATHTKAVERFNVGITASYNKDDLRVHQSIVDLRNSVIAHFGSGESGWHDERVVYFENGNRAGLTTVHKRTNFEGNTIDQLLHLCSKAISYAKQLERDRASVLSEVLSKVPREVEAVIDHCIFEPFNFYDGSESAIRSFWENHRAFQESRNQ
ncbi:hypothetical protein [Rhizobium leguminosarum]|uniref:hypothetical protein n=1 Tax=Rhizobium leguminosarum TaxID=384 RepID=UPI001C9736AD|nr:hypothetical protein [Rhizobium leguminosarum]MBY5431657.1 hypothetical protein [Rhizobium leguminosarum]